jgi:hypothetical protein
VRWTRLGAGHGEERIVRVNVGVLIALAVLAGRACLGEDAAKARFASIEPTVFLKKADGGRLAYRSTDTPRQRPKSGLGDHGAAMQAEGEAWTRVRHGHSARSYEHFGGRFGPLKQL